MLLKMSSRHDTLYNLKVYMVDMSKAPKAPASNSTPTAQDESVAQDILAKIIRTMSQGVLSK